MGRNAPVFGYSVSCLTLFTRGKQLMVKETKAAVQCKGKSYLGNPSFGFRFEQQAAQTFHNL